MNEIGAILREKIFEVPAADAAALIPNQIAADQIVQNLSGPNSIALSRKDASRRQSTKRLKTSAPYKEIIKANEQTAAGNPFTS